MSWQHRPLLRYRVIRSLVWLTEARCIVAEGVPAGAARRLDALCAQLEAERAPTCAAWAAGLRVVAAGPRATPEARAAAQAALAAEGHALLAAVLEGPEALSRLGVARPEVAALGTFGVG
jgi:hypothetical protein